MTLEERRTFNKQFSRFLWSSILIALSGCLGNIVDAVIVGHLIGEDGVSAINLSRPVVQFMFTLSMLLSTGAGMLVGMELGRKDIPRATYIYSLSMIACLIVGLLFTAGGLFFPDAFTHLLCNNEQLFQPTRDYLRMMLIGAPAYMMMWGLSTMVGVDGSPRLVSVAILIDNAVNLSLDIVFIKWLNWGIQGSSTATVVGHLVGIALMFWHLRYKDNHLHLRLKTTAAKFGETFTLILSQGAPLAIASVCLTLLIFSSNSIVLDSLGRAGIFAFSVCMNLLQIYNLFLAGVCRTIQSLGAIEVGRQDNEAFRLVLVKSFRFITIAMVLTCLYVWLDPQGLVKFFGGTTPDLVSAGCDAVKAFALSFIPFCYIYTLMIVYKLYSHHKMALFLSFALSLTVIPVLWVIARFAPNLIWYSYLIAYGIETVLIILFHRIGHLKFVLPEKS